MRSVIGIVLFIIFTINSKGYASTIIAAQNFEGNTVATGIFEDDDLGTTPGTIFDSGSGLGWVVSFVDTGSFDGPIFGLETSDLIGVVNVNSPVVLNGSGNDVNNLRDASNISGNWFHVDDADGEVVLTFDTIDATSFSNLSLDFDWTISFTRPMPVVEFDLSINGISFFNITGDSINNDLPFVENFTTVTLDISQLDFSELNIVLTFRNFVDPGDFGFDNLVVRGEATDIAEIPVPAAFWLFAPLMGLLIRIRRNS